MWAAGGSGKALVDAAAQALVDGLDSPLLRFLAGATAVAADRDALDWAQRVFDELGLTIHERGSSQAIIVAARVLGAEFLSSGFDAPRFAGELYRMSVQAGDPDELAGFTGFDDYFRLIAEGVVSGSHFELTGEFVVAVRTLVDGDGRSSDVPDSVTTLIELRNLIQDLAEAVDDPACGWENPTMESYGDAVAGWLNDVRRGPWVASNLGRTLPDESWLAVRDVLRFGFDSQPTSIRGFLNTISEAPFDRFGDDEFWLLSSALIAGTAYE